MRRAAVAAIMIVAVACGARGAKTAEGRVCKDAETLSLSGSTAGGATVQQVQLAAKIAASSLDLTDPQVRAAVQAFGLHLTSSRLADPQYLAALLDTCRRKGLVSGP
jgi:ABC-type phosphate transport system substrate-binding protein